MRSDKEFVIVNNDFLEKAKKAIPDPKALTIVASRRARQLAMGARPMVKTKSDNFLDIAMLEIGEGKLAAVYPEDITEGEVDLLAPIAVAPPATE